MAITVAKLFERRSLLYLRNLEGEKYHGSGGGED